VVDISKIAKYEDKNVIGKELGTAGT